jgi:hypothetical protein
MWTTTTRASVTSRHGRTGTAGTPAGWAAPARGADLVLDALASSRTDSVLRLSIYCFDVIGILYIKYS